MNVKKILSINISSEKGIEKTAVKEVNVICAITSKGLLALDEQAQDIYKRHKNFEFFLSRYKEINKAEK